MLGGVAWERFAIDPYPGPRPLEQIAGGRPLGAAALLADAETATPDGVRFCEARDGRTSSGEPTVLIDVTRGPAPVAEGMRAAAAELGCDLVIFADVGGDAIAHGSEPGLASPLCDAVMLAAARPGRARRCRCSARSSAPAATPSSRPTEVLAPDRGLRPRGRLARHLVDVAGDRRGAGRRRRRRRRPRRACRPRAAPSARPGEAQIRGGRRTVPLGPVGALTFFLDPRGRAGMPAARRARSPSAGDLEAGPRGARRAGHPHRARLRTRPRRRSLKRV